MKLIVQNYFTTVTNDSVARYQYSYDRDGNVIAKNNLLDSSYDETYTYDNLNRLTADTRGGSAYQSWDLDAVGNMNSITTGGTAQDNTVNSQNELTAAGSATLGFDNNGNTTTDDHGDTLIYDTWNRLVEVKNGSTVITDYTYNGMDQRITETPGGSSTTALYYSAAGQIIEEQQSGVATQQYVWDAGTGYVNQLVLRDTFSSGSFSYRLHVLQDANYNVTALVSYDSGTSTWNITQRYVYDAYGTFLTLDASWTSATGSYGWQYSFQGERYDPSTGWYYDAARIYSPTLQRFGQQDPAGYVNGANRYQFVGDDPVDMLDPYGMRTAPSTQPVATTQLARSPATQPGNPSNPALITGADYEQEPDHSDGWVYHPEVFIPKANIPAYAVGFVTGETKITCNGKPLGRLARDVEEFSYFMLKKPTDVTAGFVDDINDPIPVTPEIIAKLPEGTTFTQVVTFDDRIYGSGVNITLTNGYHTTIRNYNMTLLGQGMQVVHRFRYGPDGNLLQAADESAGVPSQGNAQFQSISGNDLLATYSHVDTWVGKLEKGKLVPVSGSIVWKFPGNAGITGMDRSFGNVPTTNP